MYYSFRIYDNNSSKTYTPERERRQKKTPYTMQHHGAILNMELVVVSVISVCKIKQ